MSAQDGLGAALTEAAVTTLETMCFAGIIGEDAACGEDALAVEVSFTGHAHGSVRVCVTPEAARNLAGGFLGQDETEVTSDAIDTVVLELANVICGRMLSMHEPDGDFTLSAPIRSGAGVGNPQAACAFELDAGAVACSAIYSQASQAVR